MSSGCYADPAGMFSDGEWFDALYCWLTAGGDPALAVAMPVLIYGTVLTGYFIVGSSPIIPVVMSLILAGVIFVTFPASALTILIVTILVVMSAAGMALTWRLGR